MKFRYGVLSILMTSFLLPGVASGQVKASADAVRRTLKVKVIYTGAGSVDSAHKIYVLLFDANPFTAKTLVDRTAPSAQAGNPMTGTEGGDGVCSIIARESTAANKQTVTISNLKVPTVYAVAVFDKSGTYPSQLEAASGSPMGTYGSKPGAPEPIKLDARKAVQIQLTFDDSATTP